MAVKIRLQRCGAKHTPVYRMVAADSRKPRDGRFIEILGTYHPKAKGRTKALEIKLDRVDYWLSVGAQFTDTSRSLVKRARRIDTAKNAEPDIPLADTAALPTESEAVMEAAETTPAEKA